MKNDLVESSVLSVLYGCSNLCTEMCVRTSVRLLTCHHHHHYMQSPMLPNGRFLKRPRKKEKTTKTTGNAAANYTTVRRGVCVYGRELINSVADPDTVFLGHPDPDPGKTGSFIHISSSLVLISSLFKISKIQFRQNMFYL